MGVIHVTEENFEKEVLQSDIPVLVDFWAQWCGPCKMLAPVIDELAGEETEMKICKVDVDEQQSLAASYQVMSIPTMILFQKGQPLKSLIGVHSKEDIRKAFLG